jgi:hypothetical protein
VLGLAFKPGSDDVRDSPSLQVCGQLLREGAQVAAHDPVAMPNAARIQPGVRYADSVSGAAADADAVLHLTDWPEYRAIDPVRLAAVVARRNLIDGRCALDEAAWRAAGWAFRVPGREPRQPRRSPVHAQHRGGTRDGIQPAGHDYLPGATGGSGARQPREDRRQPGKEARCAPRL